MGNKLKTVDAETLLSTPMSKTMFIVDGLISQGVNVISGASKIGKSWLMLWPGCSGSPKSPLDFLGRGGTAERVSFAACGETKDTELVTTKRAVRFYSRQSRSAKTLVRACPKTLKEKTMKVRTTQ